MQYRPRFGVSQSGRIIRGMSDTMTNGSDAAGERSIPGIDFKARLPRLERGTYGLEVI